MDFYIDEQKHYGRPLQSTAPGTGKDPVDRIPEEVAAYDLLDELGIVYTRVDHSRADTIEICHRVEQVLGWPICKNLFLCNRQKTQFYLLMLEGDKVFKTKDLSKQLEVSRLSFADGNDLQRILGLQPGSVTVLGLMNDKENMVQLVMDKPIAEADFVACHPCISTSTVCFSTEDLTKKLLPALHHTPIIVDLPLPEEE